MTLRTIIAYGTSVLAIILVALTIVMFATRQDTTCSQIEAVRTVIRTILINGRSQAISSSDLTAVQRVSIVKFYDNQIALVPPKSC